MVSIKIHGILDYVIGVVLVASPYVFGFSGIPEGRNLFVVLGLGLIAYSLVTDYPLSVFKLIPLNWHLTFDVVAGIMLILGSYIFGYNYYLTMGQSAVHYILGIGAIALVAMTDTGRTRGVKRDETSEPVDINRRSA